MSKKDASKKLRPHNFIGKTKNLIIDKAMARKEELGEVDIEELEHKYLAFAIRRRNNFCYNSFTGSPMHLLGLSLVNAIITILY